MSGFRRAKVRRRKAGRDDLDDAALAALEAARPVAIGTFAPFEVALLRQFVSELTMLLQAEVGAKPPDPDAPTATSDVDRLFAEITGLDDSGEMFQAQSPLYPPDDPVIARLLPDAYADDAESASEFRRFTQDRLVAAKHASAVAVLATLPDVLRDVPDIHEADDGPVEIELHAAAAQQWLRTLNDVRLALGVRLGVEQDDDAYWDALPADDPRGTVHELYQWLGWVQETLVQSLGNPRPAGGR